MVAQQDSGELRVPCDGPVGRLARETIRSLRFFSSQFAEGSYLGMIGAVALSGAGALLKGIDTCIREHGVDITGVANPFAGLAVASEGLGVDHVGDKAALYTTAVGLALGDYSQVGAQGEMLAAA